MRSREAFSSFGLFWLSFVGLLVLPALGLAEANSPDAMAAYLFMWGIFTALMFFGTLRSNKATMFVFASLAILFFLLGLVPTLLYHHAVRWRLRNRLVASDRTITELRAAAMAPSAPPATPIAEDAPIMPPGAA